ncbi:MAG: hypothetical protein ACXAEN_14290 [Candidatus Thorarchaeota archaeon]|jgi:hypothetical protein
MGEHPVIETAKGKTFDNVITLSTGMKAILRPVSASLLQDVMSRIVDPPEPWVYNEEKGRNEPDPFDKEYLATIASNHQARARASMDAMAMFGIELVNGLPEDDVWLGKLRQFERLGYLDLSEFDMEDPIDREFVFKRYIALGNQDLLDIGKMSGIRQEDIEEAESSFRR